MCRIGVKGKGEQKEVVRRTVGANPPGESRKEWAALDRRDKCTLACSLPSSVASLIKVRLPGAAGKLYIQPHAHIF